MIYGPQYNYIKRIHNKLYTCNEWWIFFLSLMLALSPTTLSSQTHFLLKIPIKPTSFKSIQSLLKILFIFLYLQKFEIMFRKHLIWFSTSMFIKNRSPLQAKNVKKCFLHILQCNFHQKDEFVISFCTALCPRRKSKQKRCRMYLMDTYHKYLQL